MRDDRLGYIDQPRRPSDFLDSKEYDEEAFCCIFQGDDRLDYNIDEFSLPYSASTSPYVQL